MTNAIAKQRIHMHHIEELKWFIANGLITMPSVLQQYEDFLHGTLQNVWDWDYDAKKEYQRICKLLDDVQTWENVNGMPEGIKPIFKKWEKESWYKRIQKENDDRGLEPKAMQK